MVGETRHLKRTEIPLDRRELGAYLVYHALPVGVRPQKIQAFTDFQHTFNVLLTGFFFPISMLETGLTEVKKKSNLLLVCFCATCGIEILPLKPYTRKYCRICRALVLKARLCPKCGRLMPSSGECNLQYCRLYY